MITIATRESQLALWQAQFVKAQIENIEPDEQVLLLPMTTAADQTLQALNKIGGKGLFTKELEAAILDGRADIAVHSMKDVPMQLPTGLEIATICERGDVRDALVSEQYHSIEALPQGSKIGTSSLRRASQLKAKRPDLIIEPLRGNVNTRLRKLAEGLFDGIVLASVGLQRLKLEHMIKEKIATSLMLPAVGQGAVGIECRSDDERVKSIIKRLNHQPTVHCVLAERAMNTVLNGSCQVPIGGYASIEGETLHLTGLVAEPDGSRCLVHSQSGPVSEYAQIGHDVGQQLLDSGADDILQALAE